MTDTVAAQASLEAILKDEIINMYQEVAENPEGEFHFYHGRPAAEMFGYRADWLGRAPAASVASFFISRVDTVVDKELQTKIDGGASDPLPVNVLRLLSHM